MFCMAFGEAAKGFRADAIGRAVLPRPQARREHLVSSGMAATAAVPQAWREARREIFQCSETGMVICAWARLDNARELAAALSLPPVDPVTETPQLILRAYQKWGVDSPLHLGGDFAFSIHNPREQEIFAARDPIGIRPLYWWDNGQANASGIVATSIPPIAIAANRSLEPDPAWVARFVAGISYSREATPFAQIRKVAPGHSLRLSAQGASVQRFHQFRTEPADDALAPDAVIERYRELLRASVQSRLAAHEINGIETSGGLDSSTIVGLAMQLADRPAESLHGFGFARQAGEAEAILTVSQKTGLGNNHIFCEAPRPVDDALVWQILGHPAEHGTATHHYPFYSLAEQLGVQSLISGFGGDEGVTNYAPNFGREMVARRKFADLWRAGGTNPVNRSIYFAKALFRANRPSPYARNIMRNTPQRIARLPLKVQIIEDLGIAEQISKSSQYDWPIPTLSGFSVHMLGQPFVSTRTESCSLMAANFGLEYSWPLLDTRLLEYFLAAPTELKVQDGLSRALHRAAVEGIVPDERRLASSKYLGAPVDRLPAFATSPARLDARGVQWESLHPMLQELLDKTHVVGLANTAEVQPFGIAIANRKLLNNIANLDNWLKAGPASETNPEKGTR